MSVWGLNAVPRGAVQSAAPSARIRSASQPVEDREINRCLSFSFTSFNFGVQQSMLDAERKRQQHAKKLRQLLHGFGEVPSNFIFGCELGGTRQGVTASSFDMQNIVQAALPGADWISSGAYFSVFNVDGRKDIILMQDGTWTPPSGRDIDMYFNVFQLNNPSASQPGASNNPSASQPGASSDAGVVPGSQVGLVVGNLHIQITSHEAAPSVATRRRTVKMCLNYLAELHCSEWPKDFPVARLLVGDVNMTGVEAEAAMQDTKTPKYCAAAQRTKEFETWQIHTTEAGLSGDLFASMGCIVQKTDVPVGKSFAERGMRNDQHDAVGANVLVPYQTTLRGATQPVRVVLTPPSMDVCAKQSSDPARLQSAAPAPGAGQPAMVPAPLQSAAPAPGAGQPGMVPVELSDSASSVESVDFGEDQTGTQQAADLHKTLKRAEQQESDERVMVELGRLLFQKKTVEVNGIKMQYVASAKDTRVAIEALLQRRRDFMDAHRLHNRHHVFTNTERAEFMNLWKQEYHEDPHQIELQLRDSWKEPEDRKGKGKGGASQPAKGSASKGHGKSSAALPVKGHGKSSAAQPAKGKSKWNKSFPHVGGPGRQQQAEQRPGFGPNTGAVRQGKHSRFARHLQRVAGSKILAELITFTGCVDIEFLRTALGGANQPAEPLHQRDNNRELKLRAAEAKHALRMGEVLAGKLNRRFQWEDLTEAEQQLVLDHDSGALMRRHNAAVEAYGHGTMYSQQGPVHLGGSTGGRTREVLDHWTPPQLSDYRFD